LERPVPTRNPNGSRSPPGTAMIIDRLGYITDF
jgi:hypothetical protein